MKEQVILLVEDDPDDEDLTIRALGKNKIGDRVDVVRDGLEALDYLFQSGPYAESGQELPQLILLDLKLPKVDGLEVLRRLREHPRTRLAPVVVLTSSNEERDVVQSYLLGANSYIRKPVDFTQFSEAVRQLGTYWLVVNQGPPCAGEF
ncbi:MAG: response regulator [Deltaproteobacteria bacterium]|nr:response regulator [Deltaproteobacteria bacterium]MBW2417892.1 response regulator [Deltaproteobacteria bacterium]